MQEASLKFPYLLLWNISLPVTVVLGGTFCFPDRRILWTYCNVQSVFTFTPLLLSCLYWQKIIVTTDRGPEEEELIDRTIPLETNNNLVSSTEKAQSPHWSVTDVTPGSGNAPDCPVDSRVRDHTNNRIGESCSFFIFILSSFFNFSNMACCHSKITGKL